MPWLVDLAVVFCIASLAYWGLSEGLVAQALKLACLVLAILCTSWASPPLAALIDRQLHSAWSYPLAYLMVLLGVSLAAWVLTTLVRGGVDATPLKLPDRLAGCLVGLAAGWLLATAALLAALHAERPAIRTAVKDSFSGAALLDSVAACKRCLSAEDRRVLSERVEAAGVRARRITQGRKP